MLLRIRLAVTGSGSATGWCSRSCCRSCGSAARIEAIADASCSATTLRGRRDEWIEARFFAGLKQAALDAYDRIVGLALQEILAGGCITKAPGGGECAGRSPVDRGKQVMKRSAMTDGYGIPLDRVMAPASRHDSPLLTATLDKLADLGPLPEDIQVHLDAGYDSQVTCEELATRKMTGQIAHKGDKAPIQAGQRWPVERANAWHNASTACNAATSGARTSSTPTSTWPTRSPRCVA